MATSVKNETKRRSHGTAPHASPSRIGVQLSTDGEACPASIRAASFPVSTGGIPGQSSIDGSTRYVMKLWWLIEQGGAWSLLLLIPVLGLFWVFCDSPEREDMRAAARDAKRKEKEDQRLKSD